MRVLAAALCSLSVLALLGAAPNDAPTQGWTRAESSLFWNAPQGSRILRYDWFLKLGRADGAGLFADPAHLAGYGFLPGAASEINPDGLPIGLSRERDWTGTQWVGMTCAACHTGTVSRGGKTMLIEGAGGMLDEQRFDADLS